MNLRVTSHEGMKRSELAQDGIQSRRFGDTIYLSDVHVETDHPRITL
jgi:hypothetical protein